MSNSISISFRNDEEESVALFSHSGGTEFLDAVNKYLGELKEKIIQRNTKEYCPIDRFEPSTVMVDFIRWYTRGLFIIQKDLYLGRDYCDGDNSDCGHHLIDLSRLMKGR